MKRSVLAVAGALALAPLLVLAACPSLGEISVGSPPDATADSVRPPTDGGIDGRAEATTKDSGLDAPCDADVGADPHNCGRCGHDCLGGGCAGGACEPVVLYSGDTPTSIVVDGPTLFVTAQTANPDTGYVFRCATANCMGTVTKLATGLANPWFAAREGNAVYWVDFGGSDAVTDPGSVMGCPEKGCPDAGPLVYAPDGGGVDGGVYLTGLAVDPTYVYWSASTGVSGSIYRCVTAECEGTLSKLGGGFGFPCAVAVDTSYVFWIDIGTNEVLRCTLPSCSGGPKVIAHVANAGTSVGFSGLALHGGNVYWTVGVGDGGVFHCAASGCGAAPSSVATGQADPGFVAVDDSGVYWTNSGDGTVMRCPLSGCSEPTLIATAKAPFAIALDPDNVYFTSSSALGAVLRVAK